MGKRNNLQKFKDEVQVMEMGKPQKKGEESDVLTFNNIIRCIKNSL